MSAPDPTAAVAAARAGSRARRVAYPRRVLRLRVLRAQRLCRSLLRLTIGGPEATGFQSHTVDEHVRLLFPGPGRPLPVQRGDGDLDWPNPRPPGRDYSVRRHDPPTGEVDIYVVLHVGGLASDWAAAAAPGDPVHLVAPTGGVVVPDRYSHYVLAGDLSAAPVVARWLETLPSTARGWAFLEVADERDHFALPAHPGIDARWVPRGAVEAGLSDVLEQAVRSVPLPAGATPYVWVAGEAGVIRPIRRWAREELGLARSAASVVGYWKRGATELDPDD